MTGSGTFENYVSVGASCAATPDGRLSGQPIASDCSQQPYPQVCCTCSCIVQWHHQILLFNRIIQFHRKNNWTSLIPWSHTLQSASNFIKLYTWHHSHSTCLPQTCSQRMWNWFDNSWKFLEGISPWIFWCIHQGMCHTHNARPW